MSRHLTRPGGMSIFLQEGNTPLHYAALSENEEVITFLLRKANGVRVEVGGSDHSGRRTSKTPGGVFVNARNDAWETPLLRAAVGGHVPVLKALLVRKQPLTVWMDSQLSDWWYFRSLVGCYLLLGFTWKSC